MKIVMNLFEILDKMKKIQFILTLCSLSQAAYISRMANGNRVRAPTPFRPGVALHRAWTHPRHFHAASNRAPYVMYRNPPHRFPTKQYPLPARHLYYKGPWKTTARLPQSSISTSEYEFLRAGSAPPASHSDGGAIHTIPAPNLSLSEKPIVVLDTSVDIASNTATDVSKPTYEVTEKYPDVVYPMPKLERPIGFSKAASLTTPKLQALIGSGSPFQLSPDYGLSTINLQQSPGTQQQYTIQEFTGLPTQQDLRDAGADGIIIPPNALYQSDPMFVQKLQSHLLQQFPAVEFIPYAADTAQIQVQPSTSLQHQPIILIDEEDLKQEPSSFVPSIENNVFQRQTKDNNGVKVVPALVIGNITEGPRQTTLQPHNITVELVATDPHPITTTIKYIIENKTAEDTTPIYYAQVGQDVGSLVAKSFYEAASETAKDEVNDDRELKPEQKAQTSPIPNVETTTMGTTYNLLEIKTDIKNITENKTNTDLNQTHFSKPIEPANVSYSLFRATDKEPKVDIKFHSDEKEHRSLKDNTVYAGQIVKATISEDQDFNKQKATLLLKRAPIRLLAYSDINTITTEAAKAQLSNAASKVAVVKAKNPPKNKLTFDNKTGEPILRIYASYVNNVPNTKMVDNMKREREAAPVTQASEYRKSTTVQSLDKTQGFEGNQVTKFGLKLRLRRDDYEPIFEGFDD